MKITCERDKFSHAFQLAASVAATRDVKPVMQNVLIKVDNNSVILMATDSELGIRISVPGCEIKETGEAILPTKLMKSILQESSDKILEINSDDEKTIVKGTRSKFQLPTQPVEDFPEIEQFSEISYYQVAVSAFRELIKRTAFAVNEDSTKYSLQGIHLDFGETTLDAVATDGRRLAHQECAIESVESPMMEGSSLFPVKSLSLVGQAASDGAKIQIAISSNRAVFKMENAVVFTRLIEGRFPNWRKIIPTTDGKMAVELISGALLSAVKQAAIVTSDKQPGVDFVFDSGKLDLQASGSEIGESSVDLPITYTGPKTTIKIDPKFVSDYLRVLDSEKSITIFFNATEAVYYKTDDGYDYVIMPISS